MKWLILIYFMLTLVCFCASVTDIEGWAYRFRETKMQRILRWICITVVNPLFTVMYWGCWIYVFYWQKKDSKRRRK